MTTQTEALKRVLEKIATVNAMDYEYQAWAREALAQPEQRSVSEHLEPVAWAIGSHIESDYVFAKETPLYATPPQRTWVGLDEEDDIDWEEGGSLRDLVQAVEAKLKEKNL